MGSLTETREPPEAIPSRSHLWFTVVTGYEGMYSVGVDITLAA